jgi:hypothetical protein
VKKNAFIIARLSRPELTNNQDYRRWNKIQEGSMPLRSIFSSLCQNNELLFLRLTFPPEHTTPPRQTGHIAKATSQQADR